MITVVMVTHTITELDHQSITFADHTHVLHILVNARPSAALLWTPNFSYAL